MIQGLIQKPLTTSSLTTGPLSPGHAICSSGCMIVAVRTSAAIQDVVVQDQTTIEFIENNSWILLFLRPNFLSGMVACTCYAGDR